MIVFMALGIGVLIGMELERWTQQVDACLAFRRSRREINRRLGIKE